MLAEIFEPTDEPSEQAINMAQQLIDSGALLGGLGQNCDQFTVPGHFPLITDLDRVLYLLTSQKMWDEPEETRQDQYFSEVCDEAARGSHRFENKEVRRRVLPMKGKAIQYYDYIEAELEKNIEHHKVIEHLHARHSETTELEKVKALLENIFVQDTGSHIYDIVKAGYLGGVESWPIANHFHTCLKTGGIPAGWIGTHVAGGGVPEECIQLLHYGPQI